MKALEILKDIMAKYNHKKRECSQTLKCDICGVAYEDGGSEILTQKGKIEICPACHGDVIFGHGWRYNIDIMIVPVKERSFKRILKTEQYICPSRYVYKAKPKFLAFYRGGEIGAITHIAKVINVKSRIPRSTAEQIFNTDKHFKWMNEKYLEIFKLEKILPLKNEIKRVGAPPIQNRVYKTFTRFSQAKVLKDLYNKSS